MTGTATLGAAYALEVPDDGVQVTTRISGDPDTFTIRRLPDTAAHTTRDRVRAANSGEAWPTGIVSVTIGPHVLSRTDSSVLDTAIAGTVLADLAGRTTPNTDHVTEELAFGQGHLSTAGGPR